MADVHRLQKNGATTSDFLDHATYETPRTNYRRRKPRDRAFVQTRNSYGAELVSSQGGPETIGLQIICKGSDVQDVLNASDALDTALANARICHLKDPDDRVAADFVYYERLFGNQSTLMKWDVLDGDWDIEVEQLGGPFYRITGVLTLLVNRT